MKRISLFKPTYFVRFWSHLLHWELAVNKTIKVYIVLFCVCAYVCEHTCEHARVTTLTSESMALLELTIYIIKRKVKPWLC